MANPSGVHHQQEGNHASSSFNGGNIPTNGHGNSGPETSGTNLKHNPGISTDWTLEEQAILEDALNQYAAESSVIRYAKIAVQLQNKTVRDVALRCRWMTKKEYSKRRKEDSLARKSKDKKERVTDPSVKASRFMARSNVHPYATSMIPMEYDDGMAYNGIDGVTGELLDQNAKALDHISANLSTMQLQENISLLCQTRDNILKIMNEMNDMPELMEQMPPLPVKLNEELADTILPRPNLPMK
ncbi:uncharacterized protein LOC8284759 isoform X1 [Ricinus communis]|uniref:uncharacterized protein LOC8284759 isoform X1 n=1 Tax=Ricinus communis TaxID=3988 RepID=UPI0007728C3B|nr:uncharacterized protein LOC8284759 isoform X1 [Ricinus communis]|eukprot:XP_015583637.1 uncharacterized protein LOC8284759 [Ricinus communis]